jgi:hypothetical protein
MSGTTRRAGTASTVDPAIIESWLAALGLEPGARVEREGVVAWDLSLDGRLRRDLRTTLILDPTIGAIVWAHLAPPLGDGLRKAYRMLLRWNEDFPLAKFSVADDGRHPRGRAAHALAERARARAGARPRRWRRGPGLRRIAGLALDRRPGAGRVRGRPGPERAPPRPLRTRAG